MYKEQIKVLIGDNTAEYGVKIASELRNSGLYVFTRCCDGNTIYESILRDSPNVVVADLSLKNMDAVALMKKIAANAPECDTSFIITSQIKNSFIERQVMENGAAFFIARPFDTDVLCSLIKSIAYNCVSDRYDDLEIAVTDIIHTLGVPAHIKGYHYLRTAIIETIRNKSLMDSVTKGLYPTVAAKYSTTPTRVERAIRHAIELSWARCDEKMLNSIFGCTIDAYRGKPTNSEFIALIADKLHITTKAKKIYKEPIFALQPNMASMMM